MRAAILASLLVLAACKSEGTPPLPVTAAPSASSSSAPAVAGFPPLDDACVTTADCDSTSFTPDCCSRCETSVGSKAWVAKVAAYCDGVIKSGGVHCPPTVCDNGAAPRAATLGYVNALPQCVSGHCVKPH